MFKKEIIGKLLLVFGITTIIASLADFASLLLPMHLGNSQWVYSTTERLSETSIIPLLGLLSMVSGFYLIVPKENKAVLMFERVSASVCALFAALLVIFTLLFSMSVGSVENNMVSNVKGKAEKLKNQIIAYSEQAPEVNKEEINKSIKKIDESLVLQTKSISKSLLKNNLKIFTNILSYIIASVIFSLILFKSSVITRKKLYYESNQK